ncbi:hypothetical protein D3C73_737280 [compost metagenome]
MTLTPACIGSFGPNDEAKTRITLGDESVDKCFHRIGVGETDDGINRVFRHIPGLDHRNAGICKHRSRTRRMFPARQDDTFWPTPQHGFNQLFLALDRIIRVAEEQLHARLRKRIGNPACGVGEVRIVDRGDDCGDEAATA